MTNVVITTISCYIIYNISMTVVSGIMTSKSYRTFRHSTFVVLGGPIAALLLEVGVGASGGAELVTNLERLTNGAHDPHGLTLQHTHTSTSACP